MPLFFFTIKKANTMEENFFLRWIGFVAFALIVWLFFPFLKSFFVALLMVMVTFPLYHYIETKIKQYKKLKTLAPILSASIITLAFSLIVFIPITLFLFHFLSQPADTIEMITSFWGQVDTLSQKLPSYLEWFRTPLDTMIAMSETHKEKITAFLAEWLGNGLKTLYADVGKYDNDCCIFLLPDFVRSKTYVIFYSYCSLGTFSQTRIF